MPSRLSRRSALQLSSIVLSLGSAGCTTALPSSSDSPPDDPSAIPTPSEGCQVTSLPSAAYPSLPASLTEPTAKDFALEFEDVYASANLESESDVVVSGRDGWDTVVSRTTTSGFVVRVFVALDHTAETSETATAAGSESFYGWYYVTERFAMRTPGDGSGERPTSGWETIVCE